eukprot:sb/3471396/
MQLVAVQLVLCTALVVNLQVEGQFVYKRSVNKTISRTWSLSDQLTTHAKAFIHEIAETVDIDGNHAMKITRRRVTKEELQQDLETTKGVCYGLIASYLVTIVFVVIIGIAWYFACCRHGRFCCLCCYNGEGQCCYACSPPTKEAEPVLEGDKPTGYNSCTVGPRFTGPRFTGTPIYREDKLPPI